MDLQGSISEIKFIEGIDLVPFESIRSKKKRATP
jgi:hypothetical protein